MGEIVIRIPWNKKIIKRVVIGLLIALPIVYILVMHGAEKYINVIQRSAICDLCEPSGNNTESSWIVTLRHDLPFESKYGQRYEVCLDQIHLERVYVRNSSGGFDSSRAYFNKDGEAMGTWSSDDTGQAYQNGEYVGSIIDEVNPAKDLFRESLWNCKRVPAWFFNMKVDVSSS